MRSMTGYGQGSAENGNVRVTLTLRGVNHRYLDLVVRLREEYRDLEPALREQLKNELWRGRAEAVVEIEPLGAADVEVTINEALVDRLHAVQRDLSARGLVTESLSFSDLLRLPDVIRLQNAAPSSGADDSGTGGWSAGDLKVLAAATAAALEQFVAAKATEGLKLYDSFSPRLTSLGELVGQLRGRRALVAEETATTLRQRVAELLGETRESLDEDRLAQEVAYLVDKSDVAEELDRLAGHLEHFRAIMDGEDSIGKRLDFLAQEMFRELNTLGAKCRDSEMVRWVLDGKVICEQIREQVQNVE